MLQEFSRKIVIIKNNEGGEIMSMLKKGIKPVLKGVLALSLLFASTGFSAACWWVYYQPKEPQDV